MRHELSSRTLQRLAAAVALFSLATSVRVAGHADAVARSLASNARGRPDGKGLGCAAVSPSPEKGAKIEALVQDWQKQHPEWRVRGGAANTRGHNGHRRSMLQVVIRVYFHIIVQPGGTVDDGEISATQIGLQIDKLNEVFAGTGFSFVLGGTDRTVNAGWFAPQDTDTEEGNIIAFTQLLSKGTLDDLNVYIYNPFNFLSASNYPWDAAEGPKQDGVLIYYGAFAGGNYVEIDGSLWNTGARVAHEVGHWLGLLHTFEGFIPPDTTNPAISCNPKYGDRVADTPAAALPGWSCFSIGQDSCPDQPGLDPITNYMDWVDDNCYDSWTPGQIARMWNMWGAYRYNR